MTYTKDNIPIYAEEQIIQQKVKIPTNFIELKTVGKNYICSTQGWPKEPVCERYGFSANEKWVQLDISQEIMAKLELELGKEITYPLYISPKVLKRKPDEFSGITIDNEKEIICQTGGTILIQEKEAQVDFTSDEITNLKQKLKKTEELSQETQKLLKRVLKDNEEKHIAIIFFEEEVKKLTQRITELCHDLAQKTLDKKREESKNRELERIIKKLKEDEQVLIGLRYKLDDVQAELKGRIAALETERDGIQQNLTNLENKFKRIQKNFLGSLFIGISRSSKKTKKIKELKVQRVRLRAELIKKDQQITDLRNTIAARDQTINDLNTQINQLTIQKNSLERKVGEKDLTITGLNNRINDLRTSLTNESDAKTRTQNEASKLNSEINNLKNQLEYTKSNYNNYYNQIQELGELSEIQEVHIFNGATFKVEKLEIDCFEAKLSDKLSSHGSIANIEMSGIKSIGKMYYNSGLARDGCIFGSLHYKKRKVRIVSPHSYSSDDDGFRTIQWDQTSKTIADCTSHNWNVRKV